MTKHTNHPHTLDLQDLFLNYLRKNKIIVKIVLVNGEKHHGIISWFDKFVILLSHDSVEEKKHVQLIYKHAILKITPTTLISLFDLCDDAERYLKDDHS